MANQYTHYSYLDGSAPTLSNATASLTGVLDAILVNGYGAKAAAGWTKPFSSGTAYGVYQAPSGVQHFLQINDTAGSGTAVAYAFESMSAFNTGTGQFPTTAQTTFAAISKGSGSNPQPWHCFADAKSFMFLVFGGGTGFGWMGFYFGEIFAIQANDSYRTLLRCHNGAGGTNDTLGIISASIATASVMAYMPRAYTAVGTSLNVSITGDNAKSGGATVLKGIIPFPNPEEGGLYLSPLWVADPTTSPANNIRGRMRGLWHTLHPNTSINDLQTFTGVGDLAGRTFMAFKQGDVSVTGTIMIETSATLETN
jgi:hypothetical protein